MNGDTIIIESGATYNGNVEKQVIFTHQVTVNQYAGAKEKKDVSPIRETEEVCPWIEEILNSFYSDKESALEFVRTIKNMKPVQITALVNDWVKQGKISKLSCGRDLWKPLHKHGLYMPSETNWNKQVRR